MIKGRKIILKILTDEITLSSLKTCKIIFVRKSESNWFPMILPVIDGLPVLIISESDHISPQTFMINFVNHKDRIGFVINREKAAKAGIEFRSKMLRLAVDIIGGKNENQ